MASFSITNLQQSYMCQKGGGFRRKPLPFNLKRTTKKITMGKIKPVDVTKKNKILDIFAKSPTDEMIGWIKIPRNFKVVSNKNPFVTSFRTLWRQNQHHMHPDGEKLMMYPAIRGKAEAKHKHYGIAPSYTRDIMSDKFDVSEMDPLSIAKLLFNVTLCDVELKKPQNKTIEWYKEKVKHKWMIEEIFDDEDEMAFYDEESILDAPVVTVVRQNKGNCTDEILQLIKDALKPFGGYEGYIRKYQESCSEYITWLEKSDSGYSIGGGLFNPMKICQLCGMICHYGAMDRAMRQVHYSLKHYRKKSKVLKEEFKTVKKEGDVLYDIPWRCGYCFTDLNLAIEEVRDKIVQLLNIVFSHLFVLSGDIDQLLKLGYGDTYEDLSVNEKRDIKMHDQVVINEYFFHLQKKIVPIGQDVDKSMQNTINKSMGGTYFRHNSKYNSIKPELFAEISACREFLTQIFCNEQVACIGDILPNKSNDNFHQWFRSTDWFMHDKEVGCSHTEVCDHRGNFKVFGNFGAMKLSLSSILDLVDKQRSFSCILPKRTLNHTLADGTGLLIADRNHLNIFLDGDVNPCEVNLDVFTTLHDYDIVCHKQQFYTLTTTKQLELVKIVNVSGPYRSVSQLPMMMLNHSIKQTISLTLPDVNSFMGHWTGVNLKEHNFEINVPLFKYLCLRNISGKVGHNTLRQYAVGFSLRRFVIHNKVISNPNIMYESIDIHVLLSRLCMMKLKQTYSLSFGFSDVTKLVGPLRGFLNDIEMALTSACVGLFSELICNKIGISLDKVIELLKKSNLHNLLNGITNHKMWDVLLNLAGDTSFKEPKIINIDEEQPDLGMSIGPICSHHVAECEHDDKFGNKRCLCCNYKISDDLYCTCCKPKTQDSNNFFKPSEWTLDDDGEDRKEIKVRPKILTYARAVVQKHFVSQQKQESSLIRAGPPPKFDARPTTIGSETVVERGDEVIDSEIKKISSDAIKSVTESETKLIKDDLPKEEGDSQWNRIFKKTKHKKLEASETAIREIKDQSIMSVVTGAETELVSKLGLNFVEHVKDPVHFENVINSEHKTLYNLPHTAMGITILQKDVFKVINKIRVANTNVNTCGYDAYTYSLNYSIKFEDFKIAAGGDPPFSQFDLLDVAKKNKENIIIACTSCVMIGKFNDSNNEFIVIAFDEPEDVNGIGHFSPAVIARQLRGSQYFLYNYSNNHDDRNMIIRTNRSDARDVMNPGDLTASDNLICELAFHTALIEIPTSNLIQPIEVHQINGQFYLSNNIETGVHNVDKDKIHKQVPSWLLKHIDIIKAGIDGRLVMGDLPEMRNIEREMPNDVVSAIEDLLYESLRIICRINATQQNLDGSMVRQTIKGRLFPWFKFSKFEFQRNIKHKLKKMDKVLIKTSHGNYLQTVINSNPTSVVTDYSNVFEEVVTIVEIKQSFGSQLRALVSLCKPVLKMSVIKTIFDKCSLTTGPAGYGKSTQISNECGPGDLCIAMTATAVFNLNEKIRGRCKALTLEKAVFSHITCGGTLFVDEATMINWVQLQLLFTETTKLKLYGSITQIGKLDMSPTPGVRYNIKLQDIVPKENITIANTTYRIGEPMVTFLKPVEKDLRTLAQHKTTYTVRSFDDNEFQNIHKLIMAIKPNVVITPYNHNKMKIAEIIKNQDVLVVTTHAFQGMEVDKAIVVLRSDVSGRWDLNGDSAYLNSSLTRAKYHTDIIIYGYPLANVSNLNDILTVTAGFKLFGANSIHKMEGEQSSTINLDSFDTLPLDTSIGSMHNLTSEHVDILNDLHLEEKGVKVKYTKLPNGIECKAYILGMLVATMINKGGEVEVIASNSIKEEILKNIHTKATFNDTMRGKLEALRQKCIERQKNRDIKMYKVNMNLRTSNKIRELCWLVDKTPLGTLELKLCGHNVTITKTRGCPLFSGVIFECGDESVEIFDGWKGVFFRKVKTTDLKTMSSLRSVISWLELPLPGYENHDSDVGWLSCMEGDMTSMYWQLTERLSVVGVWMLNALTGSKKPRCYALNQRNVAMYNRMCKHMGQKVIDSHQSVIPHSTLIIQQKKWLGLKNVLVICDINGAIMEISKRSSEVEVRAFIIEALQDIKQDWRQIKGVTMAELDIPGLLMPLHKHFAIGTEIRQIVSSKINRLNNSLISSVHDQIRLDKATFDVCGIEIKARFPNLLITFGNYSTINSPVEMTLEQIMINSIGKLHKSTEGIVVYGGPVPIAICMQGKYYLKLRIPDQDDSTRPNYDIQLPNVMAMCNLFNESRDADNKIDLLWDNESQPVRIMLGSDIICYDDEAINKLLHLTEDLYGWVPVSKRSSDWYTFDNNRNIIGYKHGVYGKSIKNELIDRARDGKPFLVDHEKCEYAECATLLELLDHRLVRIKLKPIPNKSYVIRCVGTRQDLTGIINVKVPWIDLDAIRILQDRRIITHRTLKVNKLLLRNILLRLMTGDDDIESLLAYARTVESTQLVTDKGIQDLNTGNMLTTLNTSWYALYVHNDYLSKFKYLIMLVNSCEHSHVIVSALEHFLPGFLKLFGHISGVVSNIAEYLLRELNKNVNLVHKTLDIIKEAESINWMMDYSNRRIVYHKFGDSTSNITSSLVGINDGDDDDNLSTGNIAEDEDDMQFESNFDLNNMSDKENPNVVEEIIETEVVKLKKIESVKQRVESVLNQPEIEASESVADDDLTDYYDADVHNESTNDDLNVEQDNLPRGLSNKIEEDKEIERLRESGLTQLSNMSLVKGMEKKRFLECVKMCEQDMGLDVSKESDLIKIYTILCVFQDKSPISEDEKQRWELSHYKGKNHPTEVRKMTGAYGEVPKLIWTHWHTKFIPTLLKKFLNTWNARCPDYRIILVTDKLLYQLIGDEKSVVLKLQTPQFRSDWIRLYLLSKYGGVWVDLTSIMLQNLDDKLELVSNSSPGVYQISLFERNNIEKTYESWFIICTSGNTLMNKWYEITDEMMCNSDPNGVGALEWLSNQYGEVFTQSANLVVPNLREYLRIYITQVIAVKLNYNIAPLCTCDDEGDLTVWHRLNWAGWLTIWQTLITKNMDDYHLNNPVMKFIGKMRDIIISKHESKEYTVKPNSVIAYCNDAADIDYDVYNLSNLEVKPVIKSSVDHKLVVSKYAGVDTIIMIIGTTGDILQARSIYDLVDSNGGKPLLIMHCDQTDFINTRRSHTISVKSSELMKAGIELFYKDNVGYAVHGLGLMSRIVKETSEILCHYIDYKPLIICHNLYPNKTKMKSYIGQKWIEYGAFPERWGTSKPNIKWYDFKKVWISWTSQFSDNTLAGYDSNLYGNNKPIVTKMLTCYNEDVINEEYFSNAGPLTLNSLQKEQTTFDFKNEDVIIINFGSCDFSIPINGIVRVIKLLLDKGIRVVYIDANKRLSDNIELAKLVIEYSGRMLTAMGFNLYKISGDNISMICHGGYGTVIDCIMNGVIPIIHPMLADQFYWVEHLVESGIALRLDDFLEENVMQVCYKRDAIRPKLLKRGMYSDIKLKMLLDEVPKIKENRKQFLAVTHTLEQLNYNMFKRKSLFEKIKGIFEIDGVEYKEVYNPRVAEYCVRESLKHVLTGPGLEIINSGNSSSVIKLISSQVTETEMLQGLLTLGLNFAIVKSNGTGKLYNVFNTGVVELLIDKTTMIWHCKAIQVIKVKHQSPVTENSMYMMPNESLLMVINNYIATYSALELTCPEVLINNQTKSFKKNVRARLQTPNLYKMSGRTDMHIMKLSMYKYKFAFIGECNFPNRDLSLGLITDNDGWRLVCWFIHDFSVVVFSHDELPQTAVFVNLHINFEESHEVRRIKQLDCDLISLNRATVNINEATKFMPRSNKLLNNIAVPYKLIIADYDNRQHHNTDEEYIIKNAKQIIINCVESVREQELYDSHNQPINRCIIKNAMKYFTTELCDMNMFDSITNIFNVVSTTKPDITQKSILATNIINYIMRFYRLKEPKVIYKYDVNLENGLHELGKVQSYLKSNVDEATLKMFNNWAGSYNGQVRIQAISENVLQLDLKKPVNKINNVKLVLHELAIMMLKESYGGVIESEETSERMWWDSEQKDKPVGGDWWAMRKKPDKDFTIQPQKQVLAINELQICDSDKWTIDMSQVTDTIDVGEFGIYIAPYTNNYTASNLEPLLDFPDLKSMQLWTDTDLTDWLTMYGPKNKCRIWSREMPGKIKETEKITLTQWPIKSRSVLTQVCYEEGRSITGRMKSVVTVRTIVPNVYKVVSDMATAYFRTGWESMVSTYRAKRICIRWQDVQDWIQENKDARNIYKELNDLCSGENLVKPMSDVNVHLKLESLLKDITINVTKEQQARIIVWQRKAVCAIYSKAFVKIKERLKSILDDRIVYSDGLRPDEISAKVRLCKDISGFFENDLTKQDRQTDKYIIDVEMLIYDLLGASENMISSWRDNHEKWRFKSQHYWGTGESMRLTGQATTALGNCITNMQVHANFVKTNRHILKLALFLGDDMCMLFKEKPVIKSLRNEIACKFNMQSKDKWMVNGATFCSMAVVKTSQTTAELCPDVVRMKFRYEVTNGVHEANEQNLLMRKASYLMMLGKTPEVMQTVDLLALPIQPVHWYGFHTMLKGVAEKWNMTPEMVEGYYHQLLSMIRSDVKFSHEFRHFTSKS